ncbi:uncharacterized protein AB675_11795 [Cyphellophora attinorum]|uniref:Myb-like domain-containing protein n=1 Tax=Cyphellophora attinorum TaxID=1664694 RepID=A0A0N1H674_9EURO|nr:uncharacterized protein AB675_11795 [Phialophora attinorum]KPI36762.1 hypothetical protein AB675_11795 [Phialophora attinorum]
MASSRGGRSAQRKDTPQSPRKPPSAVGSPKQTRRSARTTSREPEPEPRVQQQQHLEPVVEELGVVEPSDDDASDITAGTQSEFQSLNVDNIIEALPSVWEDSIQLIQFFAKNRNSLEQLQDGADPSIFLFKRCKRLVEGFLDDRAHFSNRVFINTQLVAHKLRDSVGDDAARRPDAILFAANVVMLLATMITGDIARKDEVLQLIYPSFPAGFASLESGGLFSTNLASETIEFGNILRTQLFIMRVAEAYQEGVSFDPDNYIHDLFTTDTGAYRGMEIVDKGEADFNKDMITKFLQSLRQRFVTTSASNPVKLAELEEAYPFADFLQHLIRWSEDRGRELQEAVEAQGGAEAVAQRLVGSQPDEIDLGYDELAESTEQHVSTPPKPQPRKAAKKKMTKNMAANIARLNEFKAQAAAEETGFDTQSQSSVIPPSIVDRIEVLDEEDQHTAEQLLSANNAVPPNPDPHQVQRIMRELAERALNEPSSSNPANPRPRPRFDEPQPNARRLSFNDIDSQQPTPRNKKRAAAPATDDEEFETDKRPAPKRRRQVNNDNIDPQLREELPALDEDDDFTTPGTHPRPTFQTTASPRRLGRPFQPQSANNAGPSSTAPPLGAQPTRLEQTPSIPPSSAPAARRETLDPEGAFPASQAFNDARDLAKQEVRKRKTALANPPNPDAAANPDADVDNSDLPPLTQRAELPATGSGYQVRKPWTPAEEERLITLIGEVGPSYAKILKLDAQHDQGPELEERNQVQLKDKARNIKFAYLKANVALPDGFGPVSIGPKLVAKLNELGITGLGVSDLSRRVFALPRTLT